MFDFYYTFRSLTTAQQAVLTLLQFSIQADLVRTPGRFTQMGCGYAVRINEDNAYQAGLLLRQHGIAYERGIRLNQWTGDRI